MRGLTEERHIVDHISDGRDGVTHAVSEPYDLVIVDRMLPNTGRTLDRQDDQKRWPTDASPHANGSWRRR